MATAGLAEGLQPFVNFGVWRMMMGPGVPTAPEWHLISPVSSPVRSGRSSAGGGARDLVYFIH